MKIFKTTVLLMMIILLSMIFAANISVSAAHSFTDVPTSSRFNDAIDMLSTIGIIRGYNTTQFGPNDNVTRWQMALMISKLVTGDVETATWEKSVNTTSFTDVRTNHYLYSIEYAHRNGIIIGRDVEQTIFAPEDNITLQEGITMVIRALKYPTQNYAYPDSYIEKGKELGLFAGLESIGYTAALTRGETAQLLYNAAFANSYFNMKFAEDVFGISNKTIVLTATENYKITSNIAYAASGKLVFTEMSHYGRLSNAFSLDAKLFTFNDANNYLGMAYNVLANNDFSYIISIQAASRILPESSTANLSVTGSNTIMLNSSAYTTTVDGRTYILTDGRAPTGTREIIVYGMNDVFTSGNLITANQMAGTTAYYKMIAFDDNNDNIPDRILYMPFSVGEYKIDSYNRITITCPNGKVSVNRTREAIDITTLTTLKDGDYVLYSFNPQTNKLDIMKVLAVAKEGTVVTAAYSSAQKQIGIGSSTFTIGGQIAGIDVAKLEEPLTKVVAGQLAGSTIKYIADDNNVIVYYELTDNTVPISGTTYTHSNFGIVTGVSSQHININGTTTSYLVYSVDGMPSSFGMSLTIGDLVEYTLLQSTPPSYLILRKTPNPTYTTKTASSTVKTTLNSGVYTFTVTEGSSTTPALSLTVNSSTVLYVFNGVSAPTTTSIVAYNANFTNYQSVYVAYSGNTNIPAAIYIRPFDNSVIGGGTYTEFDKIVYISQNAISTSTMSGSNRLYTALDLETGNNIIVTLLTGTLTTSGYYRVMTNNIISNVSPITQDTTSSGVTMYLNTTVTIGKTTVSATPYYTVTHGQNHFARSTADFVVYVKTALGSLNRITNIDVELNITQTIPATKVVDMYIIGDKIVLIINS